MPLALFAMSPNTPVEVIVEILDSRLWHMHWNASGWTQKKTYIFTSSEYLYISTKAFNPRASSPVVLTSTAKTRVATTTPATTNYTTTNNSNNNNNNNNNNNRRLTPSSLAKGRVMSTMCTCWMFELYHVVFACFQIEQQWSINLGLPIFPMKKCLHVFGNISKFSPKKKKQRNTQNISQASTIHSKKHTKKTKIIKSPFPPPQIPSPLPPTVSIPWVVL